MLLSIDMNALRAKFMP